jgi:hypothetical protein
MVVNTNTHLNLAMVYSFNGRIEEAKNVLDLRWMALYAPVYLFAVFDSYRTTVDLNKLAYLAKVDNAPIPSFVIGAFEINYLDKRKPWIALVWSLLGPGMGHLYANRILNALFATVTWIIFIYNSKAYIVLYHSLTGHFDQVHSVVDWEWMLYIPSIYLFYAYDAYTNAVEGNNLFGREQQQYLRQMYYHPEALPVKKP